MWTKLLLAAGGAYLVAAAAWIVSAGVVRESGGTDLLNVACDPTRELWRDMNGAFTRDYFEKKAVKVNVRMSHGGSASQAQAVANGLEADVLTLALFPDTDMVRKNPPEAQAEMTKLQLLPRMAHPDEMVGPALLLTSDAGSFITGHVVFADGGMVPR